MRRRSRAGDKRVKRRRKSVPVKHRNASKMTRNRGATIASLETVAARLTHERDEALLRESANSEILRLISKSPRDLNLVFRTILDDATRICNANFGTLFRFDGENFYSVAQFNTPEALLEAQTRRGPFKPTPGTPIDKVMRTKQVTHSADDAAETAPGLAAKFGGARSLVAVPMLKDDTLIGAILIYRQEVRPFTDKQIALVQNFAAQAVIAIENARLLNETKEALEQQRASAEVLNVISNSVSDAEPVFEKIVESCERIFATSRIGLNLIGPDGLVHAGAYGKFPGAEKLRRENFPHPVPGSATGAAISAGRPIQYPDALSGSDVPEYGRRAAKIVGFRAFVMAPLLSEGRGLGAIFVGRETIGSFSDKEIALLKTFAAQAVIAIENARLLNELRQSLEQQTATADVLRVISSTPGELRLVFDRILENATRICQAKFGALWMVENEGVRLGALYGATPEFTKATWAAPFIIPGPMSATGRAIRSKQAVHVLDLAAEPGYANNDHLIKLTVDVGGGRALVAVPMLKESDVVGTIVIFRQEVQPFNEKQIVVQSFAAQAVIAIENTRLLNELRRRTTDLAESLEQQTATSEVLKVISSSPGELEPVFQAILENATRICEAKYGNLYKYAEGTVQLVVSHSPSATLAAERLRQPPFRPGAGTVLGRALQTRAFVHVADVLADPGYPHDDPLRRAAERGGVRTVLSVPMLKENELVGAISIIRQEVRPFSEKQIQLVTNFADQAVIAIENTRLLNELRQRTTDLTESLERQTATSEVLSVISSSPADIQPVLDIICERAEKLCDAETSTVCIVEGELIRGASIHGETEVGVEATRGLFPMRLTDETIAARAIRTRSVCHVADVLSDPQYQQKNAARLRGIRGALGVPMVRGDQVVGAIFVARRQPGLFSDTQVQLLKTFADQAVIAIENVRLFNETKNSLEQQTATADVLKIISRSAFDLRAVQQTLVESAARFCNADKANIIREKMAASTPQRPSAIPANSWITSRIFQLSPSEDQRRGARYSKVGWCILPT